VELAFSYADLNWQDYVVIDERLYRPAEVRELRGDYSKAKQKLGWQPQVKFEDLLKMMVEADLKMVKDKDRGI
jgi:GDPmannose 4,6-dehydratase